MIMWMSLGRARAAGATGAHCAAVADCLPLLCAIDVLR
jgi:hypothetical protein